MIVSLNDLSRRLAVNGDRLGSIASEVVASGRYLMGPHLERFEERFAAWCGVAYGVGVGNGTDALALALRSLEVGPGDRVATTANAGFYASTAILDCGAQPLYVEIDPLTGLMDPAALGQALSTIGGPVKAIVVTHLYGSLAPMEVLTDVAGVLPIIEDCAQAHGAKRDGKRAGSWGTLGCFSFFPTKPLGGFGDGGAVVTRDENLARRVRALSQYGWGEKYHVEQPCGRNSRMDEIQAALLLERLPLIDGEAARRRAIARRYREGIVLFTGCWMGREFDENHVMHLCVVRTQARDVLRRQLVERGVMTDVHYPVADHHQPLVRNSLMNITLEETEKACNEVVTLPCFAEMTEIEIEMVIDQTNKVLSSLEETS